MKPGEVRKGVNMNEDSKTHNHDQASYEMMVREREARQKAKQEK